MCCSSRPPSHLPHTLLLSFFSSILLLPFFSSISLLSFPLVSSIIFPSGIDFSFFVPSGALVSFSCYCCCFCSLKKKKRPTHGWHQSEPSVIRRGRISAISSRSVAAYVFWWKTCSFWEKMKCSATVLHLSSRRTFPLAIQSSSCFPHIWLILLSKGTRLNWDKRNNSLMKLSVMKTVARVTFFNLGVMAFLWPVL